ncbi:MAG: hypothetical protein PHX04_06530 [Bacilli bacterium]|nr:hypothetical protein [Bacilli bacterium]
MLKDLLNKEVRLTYVMGYSYGTKRGVITKVSVDYIVIDNNTLINTKMIIKVVIKERK